MWNIYTARTTNVVFSLLFNVNVLLLIYIIFNTRIKFQDKHKEYKVIKISKLKTPIAMLNSLI